MATWASSTCTMTDGKQAAWTTMLTSGDATADDDGNGDSRSPPPPPTLTGSDLVKGGETPVLLASDSLGRVGLLRFPAQLPPEPTPPTAASASDSAPPVEGVGGGEEGGGGGDVPPGPTPEEAEAAMVAAVAAMAEAVDAAVPRVSVVVWKWSVLLLLIDCWCLVALS